MAIRAYVPSAAPATLFGSSLGSGNLGGWDQGIPVVRLFMQGIAAGDTWAGEPDFAAAQAVGAHTIVLSWKETNAANVEAFLATKPAEVTCYGCYHHEPENDQPPDGWQAKWPEMSAACRNTGVIPTAILMGWTLNPASGRNPDAWRLPSGTVDVYGFDIYDLDSASSADPYRDVHGEMTDAHDFAAQEGCAWAIPEMGASLRDWDTDGSARATWALGNRQQCINTDAPWACWWDSSKPGFQSELDAPTAAAWFAGVAP